MTDIYGFLLARSLRSETCTNQNRTEGPVSSQVDLGCRGGSAVELGLPKSRGPAPATDGTGLSEMTTSVTARTIAIGDIHGCLLALDALLAAIDPQLEDVIVTLGDYVDRGWDSRGVLERLIILADQCNLVPILGNHDDMLLRARYSAHLSAFISMGGIATLASYGASSPPDLNMIPDDHFAFLETCLDYFETETHIFLHATYLPHLPMSQQPGLALRWESLRDCVPGPHHSGKTVIVGHTSQRSGEILDLGHIKCIDTRCYGGGWLTALDVHTGQVWQADRDGRLRKRTMTARARNQVQSLDQV